MTQLAVSGQKGTAEEQARITVCYYGIRGLVQPVRNLLFYLKVDFNEVLVSKTDEDVECGFNLGVPWLSDGTLKIHEQIAILVYLSERFEAKSLLGLTPQHTARINQLLFKYSVQKKRIVSILLEGAKDVACGTAAEKPIKVDRALRRLSEECLFLDFCLRSVQSSSGFILGYLSLIDFIFYEVSVYVCGFMREHIPKNSPFDLYLRFKDKFEKQSFYKQKAAKIESYPIFFPFANDQNNNLFQKAWKGSAQVFLKCLFPQQLNLAWQLLDAEYKLFSGQTVSVNDVAEMSRVLMNIIERLNSHQDPREKYFELKLQKLMTEPSVLRCFNQSQSVFEHKRIEFEREVNIAKDLVCVEALNKILGNELDKHTKINKTVDLYLKAQESGLSERLSSRAIKNSPKTQRKQESSQKSLGSSDSGSSVPVEDSKQLSKGGSIRLLKISSEDLARGYIQQQDLEKSTIERDASSDKKQLTSVVASRPLQGS